MPHGILRRGISYGHAPPRSSETNRSQIATCKYLLTSGQGPGGVPWQIYILTDSRSTHGNGPAGLENAYLWVSFKL